MAPTITAMILAALSGSLAPSPPAAGAAAPMAQPLAAADRPARDVDVDVEVGGGMAVAGAILMGLGGAAATLGTVVLVGGVVVTDPAERNVPLVVAWSLTGVGAAITGAGALAIVSGAGLCAVDVLLE